MQGPCYLDKFYQGMCICIFNIKKNQSDEFGNTNNYVAVIPSHIYHM